MMPHPDESVLLGWLSEGPDTIAPTVAMHVAACAFCQERMAALTAEDRLLRAALTLTPEETAFLQAARLPARLSRVADGRLALPWHLLGLLGASLMVALAWAGLATLAGDSLNRAWQLLNIPDLLLLLAPNIGRALLALGEPLAGLRPLALLLAMTSVVLVLLWARRATPATGLQTA